MEWRFRSPRHVLGRAWRPTVLLVGHGVPRSRGRHGDFDEPRCNTDPLGRTGSRAGWTFTLVVGANGGDTGSLVFGPRFTPSLSNVLFEAIERGGGSRRAVATTAPTAPFCTCPDFRSVSCSCPAGHVGQTHKALTWSLIGRGPVEVAGIEAARPSRPGGRRCSVACRTTAIRTSSLPRRPVASGPHRASLRYPTHA